MSMMMRPEDLASPWQPIHRGMLAQTSLGTEQYGWIKRRRDKEGGRGGKGGEERGGGRERRRRNREGGRRGGRCLGQYTSHSESLLFSLQTFVLGKVSPAPNTHTMKAA